VSPGRTSTRCWAMISPASMSALTKWTVQPVSATPALSACSHPRRPLKAGSSDGDVDDVVGERLEQRWLHHAHVAGEDDPFGLVRAEDVEQYGLALGAELGFVRRRRQRGGGQVEGGGAREDGRIRHVADDDDDLRLEPPGEDRLLERDEVAALARSQHGDARKRTHAEIMAPRAARRNRCAK